MKLVIVCCCYVGCLCVCARSCNLSGTGVDLSKILGGQTKILGAEGGKK